MKSFQIQINDANQRLDKFLQKSVPKLPPALMYKYLRTKRIKVNGKKSESSFRLSPGDEVSLYIRDEFFSEDSRMDFLLAPAAVELVYEDENLLLLNKPAGLCVHEDNAHTPDTLINRVLHYLYNKEEYRPEQELSFIPSLCNRIDRNTSGIVIAAKNAESLRILNEKIKQREIDKYYLCIACGHVRPESGALRNFMRKQENNSLVQVFDHPVPQGKTMITEYRTLARSRENTLLEVSLKTGRTHQIRAHFAHIGHPLLGDGKYGSGKINKQYHVAKQLLCSYKLRFSFSNTEHLLGYLNEKTFQLPEVWFQTEFQERF